MQNYNESSVLEAGDDRDCASTLDGVVLISLLFSCCLLPLVLTALPLASAWLSSLPGFASYRPWLAFTALAGGVAAWWRLYRPQPACPSEEGPAAGQPGFGAKVIFWLCSYATWSILGLPYFEKYLY